MTTLIAWSWYLVRLVLFPLRLALYLLHGLLIFMSKPGARTLVPAAAALGLWVFREPAARLAEPLVTAATPMLRPLLGPELYAHVYPTRLLLAAAIVLVAGTFLLIALSALIGPLLGAFPAPARPLMPLAPFQTPRLRIRSVPVRVAVRRRQGAGLEGNWKQLIRRMPPEVRALLEREPAAAGHYPGPAEMTEARPLWPPLALQPAPAPQASSAPPPEPAAATPRSKARTATAKAASRGKQATNKQAPKEAFIPPAPARSGRKQAAVE